MFVTSAVQFWSEWGLRISVLVSLAANVVLGLLSGARRRSATGGWRSFLRWLVVLILWAAYQAAEIAATSALGSLSLCGSDASADEQQLIAFWAPFLLLHLGGPDNMTAYTLEDNMLSLRKGLEMIVQILGVSYAIWNYIYRIHSWVLLEASAIVFVAGAARYVERAYALWRANLDNMQDSSKKTETAGSGCSTSTEVSVGSTISRSLGRELDDDEALLLAQDLFPIWRRALVDSSVDSRSSNQRTSEKIFLLRWRSMCKVVEMELSLMYEVLYTKANVVRTCRGYLIRFMSPLATAAAATLFWLYHNKEVRRLRGSFVLITYLLLGAAFALDVVWLLRALGSTWTYYFLKKKKKVPRRPWAWFEHKVLCSGRWRRLHRAVVYLDPLRLVLAVDPVRYRRWSGTIGRYNLLRECTSTTHRHPWWRWLATKLGLEETRYLSELPKSVRKLLFKRVRRILPAADNPPRPDGDAYTMTAIRARWGKEAVQRDQKLFEGKNSLPKFGREFKEDVIAWHIATCIFLSRNKVSKSWTAHAAAIEVMSEYLMFLVAQRPQMLPGLVLRNLLEGTRRALDGIWDEGKTAGPIAGGNIEKLATILRRKRIGEKRSGQLTDEGGRLVSDGTEIAAALTKGSRGKVPQMLELIFNVWVDKLVYAGVRCSRECHAKQLSAGGELTTVLWIIVQHAGPFRIGEEKPQKPLPEEKKMKPEVPADTPKSLPRPCYCGFTGMSMPLLPPPPPWDKMPMPPSKEEEYGGVTGMLPKMPSTEDKPEEAEEDENPDDAEEYKMPIEYITLY